MDAHALPIKWLYPSLPHSRPLFGDRKRERRENGGVRGRYGSMFNKVW